MHGTIVVLANATTPAPAGTSAPPKSTGTTPSAGAANSGATSGSGASTASGQTLPNTGTDLTGTLGLAVVLAAAGLALRRALTLR